MKKMCFSNIINQQTGSELESLVFPNSLQANRLQPNTRQPASYGMLLNPARILAVFMAAMIVAGSAALAAEPAAGKTVAAAAGMKYAVLTSNEVSSGSACK